MATITCIEDLRKLAERRVPRMFYDYADSGAWSERTYRDNRRCLRQDQAAPARRPQHRQPHGEDDDGRPGRLHAGGARPGRPDGHAASRRRDPRREGREKFGVPFTLSTMSICSIEDVAENDDEAVLVSALRHARPRLCSPNLIGRAKAAGCSALVLTLDLQILGQRHKDVKNGLSAPPKLTIANIINLATSRPGASACSAPSAAPSATSSAM
jgi:L-lactate dehydrogenase (cytochrome)